MECASAGWGGDLRSFSGFALFRPETQAYDEMSGLSDSHFATTKSRFRERTQKGESANKTERLRASRVHSHHGGCEVAIRVFALFVRSWKLKKSRSRAPRKKRAIACFRGA